MAAKEYFVDLPEEISKKPLVHQMPLSTPSKKKIK